MDPHELVAPWSLTAGWGPDATAVARRRIDAVEERIEAWVALGPDGDAPADGPLAGVPVGIKDIIDVAGLPTRCGVAARSAAPPAADDAAVVDLLRAAGVVIVGKTVTTELAYFDPGPTRNPHDPTRTPGGSSSGSAAAVAAGMVPLAVGTQTAGSLVRPASFCGVAGLAVARGTLPMAGVTPLAPGLDTLGLFAATVADLALVRTALDGRDAPGPSAGALACWPGTEVGEVSGPMRDALDEVAHRCGAVPAELDLRQAAADQLTVMAAEAADTVPPLELLGRHLQALVAQGRAVHPEDLAGARERSAVTREHVLGLLDEVDAILAPGALGAAPHGLASTGDPAMSRPWHVLGLPVLAVPGARDGDGMPLGLALVGHPDREDALLAVGQWLEHVITDRA